MKEVTIDQIKAKHLRLAGRFVSSDFSKIILLINRASDKPQIKYY